VPPAFTLLSAVPSAVATAINLMYHSSLGSALTNTGAVRALLKRLSTNEG